MLLLAQVVQWVTAPIAVSGLPALMILENEAGVMIYDKCAFRLDSLC